MSEFTSTSTSGSDDVIPAIHLLTPAVSEENKGAFEAFREKISGHPLFGKHQDWINDTQVLRFLIARNYKVQDAYKLMAEALEW